MELSVIESKGTAVNIPPPPRMSPKEIKDEKADYNSIAFDPYSDFMDPERESQW